MGEREPQAAVPPWASAPGLQGLLAPARYPPSPVREDPDAPRAAAWLSSAASAPGALVVGVPFAALSLSGARCDLLPAAVRAAAWAFSLHLPERGVDLTALEVADLGDVVLDGLGPQAALERVRTVCERIAGGPPVAVVGGDNSITAPAMLGLVGPGGGLLTLDAHHDLRDFRRHGLSNGSPVRVLLEAGVDGPRIRQVGIADLANARAHAELARSAGIGVVGAGEARRRGVGTVVAEALQALAPTGAIYVDVDLDVVDRAAAPGAPAAQPGGLAPAEVLEAAFLCGAHPLVRALDVVEVDPERDVNGVTVRLAAAVVLSFLAGVAAR